MKARGGNDMRAWADFDDYYNQRFGGNKWTDIYHYYFVGLCF
jgi:hypothetical protein